MCLIVDANVASELLSTRTAVTDWLLGPKGNPRLVAAGLLRRELSRLESVRKMLVQLDRAGRLRKIEDRVVEEAEADLRLRQCCRSNDVHIVALAIVSGARTLATRDNRLMKDFRDRAMIKAPRGSIYLDPYRHQHLLRHTPQSCGIQSSRRS